MLENPKGSGKSTRNAKGQLLPGSGGYQPIQRLKSAAQWAKEGVLVRCSSGDLPREERETTTAFTNTERVAEVTTCEPRWMRRLEEDGAKPETIHTYEKGDGECRFYVIPKSWMKMPYKPKRKDD